MRFLKIAELPDKDWLDYTSLSTYTTCPRKYWWKCIRNVQEANIHPALTNGKAYHEGIATYHECKKTMSHKDAVRQALIVVAERMTEIKVEDPARNTSVAIETVNDYLERWKDDQAEIIDVELGGAVDLGDFVYVGLIDAIVNSAFGYGIRETKTTTVVGERWQLRGKPNMQLEGYMFMASVLTGIKVLTGWLDVIPVHADSSKRKPPFRIMTQRSEGELANWHKEVSHWYRKIKMDKELNFFPKDTDQCTPLRSSDCPYTTLCRLYPDPFDIETLELPAEFSIKPWLPLESLRKEDSTNGNS